MQVKNYHPEYNKHKTIRQWALDGFLPKKDAEGIELWSNQNCEHQYRYYSPDEVEQASKEQLYEFFGPERERKNAASRRRRRKKSREKKCANMREKMEAKFSERKIEKKYDFIVVDTETTGLDCMEDELLQVSIISNTGETLFDRYFKPTEAVKWPEAERVNHISPDDVKDAKPIFTSIEEISEFFYQTDKIVGYNTSFDLDFLIHSGVCVAENAETVDVMKDFAEIYGEWNDYYEDYKWQKLTTAADYYGYEWPSLGAHNSLADCLATLFVYEKMSETKG